MNETDNATHGAQVVRVELRTELIEELLAEARKLTATIAAQQAILDQFDSAARALQGAGDALASTVRSELADVDMNLYLKDDAPRAGCTLVIRLQEKGWKLDAYAPGFGPSGAKGRISSYFSRRLGSTGIAVDALIERGFDWGWAIGQMNKAEDAYAASLGSPVTV
jgi:hypothetical protein